MPPLDVEQVQRWWADQQWLEARDALLEAITQEPERAELRHWLIATLLWQGDPASMELASQHLSLVLCLRS